MLIYNQEQHTCQLFLQKLWLGFIHVHDDGRRIHILHKNGRRKYYLKVNVLSLDGADSFFHFTTSDKLRPKMSENRGYVYPETGIGKPTQPRTDQVSMALPPFCSSLIGHWNCGLFCDWLRPVARGAVIERTD
jgi:hypothetical protein